ncbi:hypothetical protein DFH27DRAFT_570417 [Peziza echinospora]|nr:hypothetical protein DFH27DRAFT_570417 [Peziza echinospora]
MSSSQNTHNGSMNNNYVHQPFGEESSPYYAARVAAAAAKQLIEDASTSTTPEEANDNTFDCLYDSDDERDSKPLFDKEEEGSYDTEISEPESDEEILSHIDEIGVYHSIPWARTRGNYPVVPFIGPMMQWEAEAQDAVANMPTLEELVKMGDTTVGPWEWDVRDGGDEEDVDGSEVESEEGAQEGAGEPEDEVEEEDVEGSELESEEGAQEGAGEPEDEVDEEDSLGYEGGEQEPVHHTDRDEDINAQAQWWIRDPDAARSTAEPTTAEPEEMAAWERVEEQKEFVITEEDLVPARAWVEKEAEAEAGVVA